MHEEAERSGQLEPVAEDGNDPSLGAAEMPRRWAVGQAHRDPGLLARESAADVQMQVAAAEITAAGGATAPADLRARSAVRLDETDAWKGRCTCRAYCPRDSVMLGPATLVQVGVKDSATLCGSTAGASSNKFFGARPDNGRRSRHLWTRSECPWRPTGQGFGARAAERTQAGIGGLHDLCCT